MRRQGEAHAAPHLLHSHTRQQQRHARPHRQQPAGASRAQGAEWCGRGREGGLEAAACCARSSQVCVGTALVELVSSACQPRPRLPLPAAPALLLSLLVRCNQHMGHVPACFLALCFLVVLVREKLVSLCASLTSGTPCAAH